MKRTNHFRPGIVLLISFAASCLQAETISFNDHIRPILSDRCFACHGPDSAARKANLRLDLEESTKAVLGETGAIPIVPGKSGKSAILHRLTSDDPDERMPPPESNMTVSDSEVALIRQWIDAGAQWERHWAFISPEKPALPKKLRNNSWAKNEIDYFILVRLEAEGLTPSPPAGKEHLLRRATFDLTGLPPTLQKLDDFLEDESEDAFERAVDRLLDSAAFGERLALEWLDVARYGDTDGLFEDHPRSIYPWRDWLVKAFNDNLRYSDFISWQLAGDLYPNPSVDQKLATGFLRNNPTSNEGGIIDEDYRIKYLVDRVNTTSTAFLGLTMECAQCHDHKFDPMTQREYYQFGGFFNSLVGQGNTKGATAPTIRLLAPEQEARLAAIGKETSSLENTLAASPPELLADFEQWNAALDLPIDWQEPVIVSITVLDAQRVATPETKIGDAAQRNAIAFKPNAPALSAAPESYAITLGPPDGGIAALRFSSELPAVIDSIQIEAVSESGKRALKIAGETKFRVDKDPKIIGLEEVATFAAGEQLVVTLTGDPIALAVTSDRTAASRASIPLERDKRLEHYRKDWPGFKAFRDRLAALQKEKGNIEGSAPVTMVAADEANPRTTHILMRGEYDKPGEEVAPAAPASIMPFPDDLPKNRRGLAMWMVDPDNPLTARVAVNRYWQMIFGAGIVTTSEDLGTQGARPSHQALLDFLAVEFMQSGWNLKALIRKIVTSATYRQTSMQPSRVAAGDSDNRFLSRAPRKRLSAEFIRDHALTVSGLLVHKPGGPGVNPYQPAELFGRDAIGASNVSFKLGSGDDLYRRSLYTYWKRQIPAANMRILGADGRTACRTRRERTNTPLQALVLLNDPQFVEAARVLGERMMTEGGEAIEDRLGFAFRLATSRRIADDELSILVSEFQDRLREFQANPRAAADYLNGGGTRKSAGNLDAAELAAYVAVAALIMNLDESISKS